MMEAVFYAELQDLWNYDTFKKQFGIIIPPYTIHLNIRILNAYYNETIRIFGL